MSFDFSTLITDRSSSDVSRVRQIADKIMSGKATADELAEFNSVAMKGAYNYTDLNRVNDAMDEINRMFTKAGYVTKYKPFSIERPDVEMVVPVDLPEGYTSVEYIESTGTQFFSIPPIGTANDFELIFDVLPTSYSNDYAVLLTNADTGGIWLGKHKTDGFVVRRYSVGNDIVVTPPALNERVSIRVAYKFGTVNLYYNDVLQGSATINYTETSRCYLLSDGDVGTGFCGKFYGCKYISDNTVGIQYIPVIRGADGAAGVYDVTNKVFHTNAGAGSFSPGESEPRYETVIVPNSHPVNAWVEPDVPTVSQMAAYLANVEELRSILSVLSTTPKTPTDMDLLTWAEANNIEQILTDVSLLIRAVSKTLLRSNMAWAVSGSPGFYFMN